MQVIGLMIHQWPYVFANSLINDGFNLKEQLKNYQLWIEYGHFHL